MLPLTKSDSVTQIHLLTPENPNPRLNTSLFIRLEYNPNSIEILVAQSLSVRSMIGFV